MMTEYKKVLSCELEVLELSAFDMQAQRHWAAGRRDFTYKRLGHVSIIFINALIASTLFGLFKDWVGGIAFQITSGGLSLMAALISALLLQFKPEENFVGHRLMGAKFASIARDARQLKHQIQTNNISEQEAWVAIKQLNQRYDEAVELGAQYTVGKKITTNLYNEVEPKRQKLIQTLEEINNGK